MDKQKKTTKPKQFAKIENSKSNRNFLNWLVYHLSNGISFEEAVNKTVKTFQMDVDKGKLFSAYKDAIRKGAELLVHNLHNSILK